MEQCKIGAREYQREELKGELRLNGFWSHLSTSISISLIYFFGVLNFFHPFKKKKMQFKFFNLYFYAWEILIKGNQASSYFSQPETAWENEITSGKSVIHQGRKMKKIKKKKQVKTWKGSKKYNAKGCKVNRCNRKGVRMQVPAENGELWGGIMEKG